MYLQDRHTVRFIEEDQLLSFLSDGIETQGGFLRKPARFNEPLAVTRKSLKSYSDYL